MCANYFLQLPSLHFSPNYPCTSSSLSLALLPLLNNHFSCSCRIRWLALCISNHFFVSIHSTHHNEIAWINFLSMKGVSPVALKQIHYRAPVHFHHSVCIHLWSESLHFTLPLSWDTETPLPVILLRLFHWWLFSHAITNRLTLRTSATWYRHIFQRNCFHLTQPHKVLDNFWNCGKCLVTQSHSVDWKNDAMVS